MPAPVFDLPIVGSAPNQHATEQALQDEVNRVIGLLHAGTEAVAADVVAVQGGVDAALDAIDMTASGAAQAAGVWGFVNAAYQAGKIYNSVAGALQDNAGYRAMLVAVSPGDIMRFSGGVQGVSTALAAWVNSAGSVIGRLHVGTASEVVYTDVVAVAPAGAVGVWMTGDLYAVRFPMAERLAIGATLPAAPSQLARDADEALSEWQEAPLSWVTGSFIDRQTGGSTASGSYRHTKISVTPGEALRLTGDVQGTGLPLWIWYNGSGQVIYSHGRGEASAVALRNEVVIAPAGAAQLGVTQLTAAAVGFVVERQARISSVPGFVAARLDDQLRIWSDANFAVTSGSYIGGSDGAVVAKAGYSYGLLPVAEGDVLRISADLSGSALALVVWYGAGSAFLGSYGAGSNGTPAQYRDVDVLAPPGAVQAGISWRTSDAAALRVQASTVADSLAGFVDDRMSRAGVGGYWSGRTVAWFGTSIPAGSSAGGRYPQLIGAQLGATVYNEALSGSPARGGVRSAVTGGDPYGFVGTNWAIATKGLAHTLAEKADIIANWATYRTLFASGSSPPVTLSAAQQAEITGSSYEVRLVANHLGANRRDCYVFDHGFNDAGLADDLTAGAIGSRDRLTYRGAINYLIDLILADNPRATILFVGHYDAADPGRTTLIAAQQSLAANWSRPLWRGWEALGWSSAVDVTTTGYWSSNLWVPSGGPSQTLSMNEVWTPDGVHPGQDVSGDSIRRIVAAMLPWWQSVA